MTVSASTQIPKTSDPAVFQRQCKVLFEEILDDPTVKEFGSSGQRQQGLDILGRRRKVALDHWVGVQCKLTIKSEKLPKGTLAKEAAAALKFKPFLKEFILVTTAADDAVLDAEAAELTDQQARLGRDFTVQVWGWQMLQTHILQSDRAIAAFSPDAFPHLKRLSAGQDKIVEVLDNVGNAQQQMLLSVKNLERSISVFSIASSDTASLGTFIDQQIDQFRALLIDGRPRTALDLLENLQKSLPATAEQRLKFRIQTNIATCRMRLGEQGVAADLYIAAYDIAPNEPKAAPLKILGLLLSEKADEALSFGTPFLKTHSDQSMLVSYLLMAKAKLIGRLDDDPFSIIPPSLERDPLVAVAKLDYLRSHPNLGNWHDAAISARESFPSDEHLVRYAADATIDKATTWYSENGRAPLPASMRDETAEAAAILRAFIEKLLSSEINFQFVGVASCCNLVMAYRLLQQHEEALEILDACISRSNNDGDLQEQKMIVALEAGRDDIVRKLVLSLPPSRDTIFGRLQIYANSADWTAVVDLGDHVNVGDFGADDAAFFESVLLLAKIKQKKVSTKSEIVNLLVKYPDQPVVPIILYEAAAVDLDDAVLAKFLYDTAVEWRTNLNSACRLMLARTAELEGDTARIVDLLDGLVDTSVDSKNLRLLARGFVNSAVSSRALDFAKRLPKHIADMPFFARVVASIHFNAGNLPLAERSFLQAIEANGRDLAAHLGLLDTWMRQDKRGFVEAHLQQLNVSTLSGPPFLKMRYCHLLSSFGMSAEGFSLAYKVATENRDDVQIVQMYIGLVLPSPLGIRERKAGQSVGVDDWVQIERPDGTRIELVIELDPSRSAINHYGPEHPLSAMLLGKNVSDEVTSTPTMGTPQTWKIVARKHKYVALLAELISTLPIRFPDAGGFHQFELKDGDIKPILDTVKEMSLADTGLFEMYSQGSYPIGLASAVIGRTSVEFAYMLVQRNAVVKTCLGTEDERVTAMKEIRKARASGIVLDALTVWTAYSLEIIPHLKTMFSRVGVPQSAIDELSEWRDRFRNDHEQPLRTIGYAQGDYFRDEISQEAVAKTYTQINAGIELIRRELEVLPAAAPSSPAELDLLLRDVTRRNVLDAVYISANDGLLLIADDISLRNYARQAYGIAGAWLQPVLMATLNARKISLNEYATAVAGLAALRHDYVSLNLVTLLSIAIADSTPDMSMLRAAANFIGPPNGDFGSNQQVAKEFLSTIWKAGLTDLRQQAAAGIMVERLVEMYARGDDLREAYLTLLHESSGNLKLKDYLIRWARGHFIFH